MSKSMIISLVSMVIGLLTIAVGLYVLSITPAPEQNTSAANDPFIMVPQVQNQTPATSEVPSASVTRGSEPWCEQMMLLPDADWADADAQLFAQNCLYE